MPSHNLQFLLNHQLIELENIDPNLTVLKYLREYRGDTGTKEGCGSGDCGACTVVLAQLSVEMPYKLNYHSINSCITLMGQLQGKQLITVEHLKQSNQLHPVQRAIVDQHASQCGFCTPGIVMSSFALQKNCQDSSVKPSRHQVLDALAGNLCRCTGYRSIIDASLAIDTMSIKDSFSEQSAKTIEQLISINSSESLRFNANNNGYFAPKNCLELATFLMQNPNATLLAGGTDLALQITQNHDVIKQLVYLGDIAELQNIQENKQQLVIGSVVTYAQFQPLSQLYFPELAQMIDRIGSTQIRNHGTIGGNIANASPIGDMPPVLLAIDATLELQRGEQVTTISLDDFFIDYKQTALKPSEFIKNITIRKPSKNNLLKVYKISKRFDDDISTILAAINIELSNNKISKIRIAFGGMAAIPKRALHCENALIGHQLNQQNISLAIEALNNDFQPMSDVRASSGYRLKVAQNILQKFYLEVTNNNQPISVMNYA